MYPKIRCDRKSEKFYKIFWKLNRAELPVPPNNNNSVVSVRAADVVLGASDKRRARCELLLLRRGRTEGPPAQAAKPDSPATPPPDSDASCRATTQPMPTTLVVKHGAGGPLRPRLVTTC
jgi:hypothetical protein